MTCRPLTAVHGQHMASLLRAACALLSIVAFRSVAGNGELGQASNTCYSTIPSQLPLTISYSRQAAATNTTFTFLVNVIQPRVNAFGIRLNSELAAIPERISAIPQGQLIPPMLGGPAYLWNISSTGQQLFQFTVNTTGIAANNETMSRLRLSDICAQGIKVVDEQGNSLWQQPQSNGSCVVWVKQDTDCTFQTFPQHSTAPNSTRSDPYTPTVPSPSSTTSDTIGAYSPSPVPTPYGYSPRAVAPSPYSPAGYAPTPKPYSPASPALLFGVSSSPAPASPRLATAPGVYSSPTPSPYGYGASPYGPQTSPKPSASPYYGPPSSGVYSSPSAAAGGFLKQPLFGRRTTL